MIFKQLDTNAGEDLLGHVDDASDAVSSLHLVEGSVDSGQVLAVSDEFVHLQLAIEVVINEVRKLSAPFDPSKGASFPHTACDELECYWEYVSMIILCIS